MLDKFGGKSVHCGRFCEVIDEGFKEENKEFIFFHSLGIVEV